VLPEKMIHVPEIEEQIRVIRWVIPRVIQEKGLLIGFYRVLEVPLFP